MYGLLDGVAGPPPTRPADAVLRALMSSLGASGLRAAAEHPRLLSAVDQHVAAIRDGLAPTDGLASADGLACATAPDGPADITATGGSVSLASLAGYAEGVRETALAHGWQPPTGPVDWSAAPDTDWVLLRLLAVCALARGLGIDPAPAVRSAREPERGAPPAG